MLSKEQHDKLLELHTSHKNGDKFKKNDQVNSSNKRKTNNKPMKKIISASVASSLSQLDGSWNKYDGEEKNKPDQSSSTNSNKKVCLKIFLKKISEDKGSYQRLWNISPPSR